MPRVFADLKAGATVLTAGFDQFLRANGLIMPGSIPAKPSHEYLAPIKAGTKIKTSGTVVSPVFDDEDVYVCDCHGVAQRCPVYARKNRPPTGGGLIDSWLPDDYAQRIS